MLELEAPATEELLICDRCGLKGSEKNQDTSKLIEIKVKYAKKFVNKKVNGLCNLFNI